MGLLEGSLQLLELSWCEGGSDSSLFSFLCQHRIVARIYFVGDTSCKNEQKNEWYRVNIKRKRKNCDTEDEKLAEDIEKEDGKKNVEYFIPRERIQRCCFWRQMLYNYDNWMNFFLSWEMELVGVVLLLPFIRHDIRVVTFPINCSTGIINYLSRVPPNDSRHMRCVLLPPSSLLLLALKGRVIVL